MADARQNEALAACDDALRTSISNISSVLLNRLISAKTAKQRQTAVDAAQRGVELTKETHSTMRGIVESVFS